MKKLNVQVAKSAIFRLLVFLSLFLTQCKNETEKYNFSTAKSESGGFTQITGYIHNRDFYPNTNDINMIIPSISGEDRVSQIETPINDDGTFYFVLYLSRSQEVKIESYLDFLYLVPGDSLHIEINFKNLRDVQLSGGKSAEINREFHKYFVATGYRTSLDNYGVGTDCEMNCSWDEIIKKFDEERNLYRDRRQAFLQENIVCNEVAFLTEAMIELDYYKAIVETWSRRHDTYLKEVMDQETLINEMNEVAVKYFNSNLYSDAHFKFIGSAYMPILSDFKQISNDITFVDWAKEVAKTDIIKEFMLTVQAGKALLQKDLDGFEKISPYINQEYLHDRLMQEYGITQTRMINPEDVSSTILGGAPNDFTNNILFGNENILSKIIAPNYGKVQVINTAMGWCGGAEIEQLSKLKEEYNSNDVHVSYINFTADNEEIRKIIREQYRSIGIDSASVHFPTEDERLFLKKTLHLLQFPHSILVNKKGVIVDNGPFVNSKFKLQEKIDLLLEQEKLIK